MTSASSTSPPSCSCPTLPDSIRVPGSPISAVWDCCPTGCWAPSWAPAPTPRSGTPLPGEKMSTNPFDDETGSHRETLDR